MTEQQAFFKVRDMNNDAWLMMQPMHFVAVCRNGTWEIVVGKGRKVNDGQGHMVMQYFA